MSESNAVGKVREGMRKDVEQASTGAEETKARLKNSQLPEASPPDRPNQKRHAKAADPKTVAGAKAGSTEHVPMTREGTPDTAKTSNAVPNDQGAPQDANETAGRTGTPVNPADAEARKGAHATAEAVAGFKARTQTSGAGADLYGAQPDATASDGGGSRSARTQQDTAGRTPPVDTTSTDAYKPLPDDPDALGGNTSPPDAARTASGTTVLNSEEHATRPPHNDLNDLPPDRKPDGSYITEPALKQDALSPAEQQALVADPNIPRDVSEAAIPPLAADVRLRDMHYREGAVTDVLPLTDAAYRFGMDTTGGMATRGTEAGYVPEEQPATSGPNTAMEDKREHKRRMREQGAKTNPTSDPRA